MVPSSQTLLLPLDRFHLDQIHNSSKMILSSYGNLNGNRAGTQALLDHPHHAEEVSPKTVDLIDECDAGNPILIGLTPNRFSLRLDRSDGAKYGNSPIKHP